MVPRDFQRIRPLILAAALAFATLSTAVGDEASRPEERKIREDLIALGSSEKEADDARDRLKSAALRERAIEILREELVGQPEPSLWVVNGIAAIEARELLPELVKAAAKAEQHRLFSVLNQFLKDSPDDRRTEIARIYLQRLDKVQAPTKIAILEGLVASGTVLTAPAFAELATDSSHHVRIALVRHFFATRAGLAPDEMAKRMKTVLTMKPYQARQLAMRTLLALAEKRSFKGLLTSARCEAEPVGRVKKLCRRIVEELGEP